MFHSAPGPSAVRTMTAHARRANEKAAKRFFRKLLKGLQYLPRVIITDKLKSSGAAKREILPGVVHRQHKGLNYRTENLHRLCCKKWQRKKLGVMVPLHRSYTATPKSVATKVP